MLRKLFLLFIHISLIFTAPLSYADATEGELFGYKLGDKYTFTDKTIALPHGKEFHTLAETPVTPEDIEYVLLNITATSHTITQMVTETIFENNQDALSFAKKYANILRAKYGKYETKPIAFNLINFDSVFPSILLQLEFEDTHMLTVMFVSTFPSSTKGVGVTPRAKIIFESKKHKDMINKEYKDMVLHETKEKKSLQGL